MRKLNRGMRSLVGTVPVPLRFAALLGFGWGLFLVVLGLVLAGDGMDMTVGLGGVYCLGAVAVGAGEPFGRWFLVLASIMQSLVGLAVQVGLPFFLSGRMRHYDLVDFGTTLPQAQIDLQDALVEVIPVLGLGAILAALMWSPTARRYYRARRQVTRLKTECGQRFGRE